MKKLLLIIEAILLVAGLAVSILDVAVPNLLAGEPQSEVVEMQTPQELSPSEETMTSEGMANPSQATPSKALATVTKILPILMYLVIAYYVFLSFKKPHGNSLKVIMIIFAFYLAILSELIYSEVIPFMLPVSAVLVAFISGRLDRFVQNRILMSLVAILLIIFTVGEVCFREYVNLGTVASVLSNLLIWAAIVNAYILRFKEHRLAGMPASDESPESPAR